MKRPRRSRIERLIERTRRDEADFEEARGGIDDGILMRQEGNPGSVEVKHDKVQTEVREGKNRLEERESGMGTGDEALIALAHDHARSGRVD